MLDLLYNKLPLTSLLSLLLLGNLLLRVYAFRISHGCGLGRLSKRGQVLGRENIPQRVYSIHRDGTVYKKSQ